MSSNKKQTSQITAIIKNVLRPGGRSGTEVCATSVVAGVVFVFTMIVVLFSLFASFFINLRRCVTNNIVIVNAPESFTDFLSEAADDAYSYTLYFEDWDALYDYTKFTEFMQAHDASAAFVFPEDFDEAIKSDADILSYYKSYSLSYRSIREDFEDTVLADYKDYLALTLKISNADSLTYTVAPDNVPTESWNSPGERMANSMARSFIPLIIFIAILYLAMSSGTEEVAGQKERGTLARIILTPVPRIKLALGYTLGVFLKAFIPVFVVISLICLIRPYRSIGAFITVLVLSATLALFISCITVIISVLNDTVTAAQTAFLPVFFVFIVAGVTCISDYKDSDAATSCLPLYGQFYGIGDALTGTFRSLSIVVCSLLTLLLSGIMILISARLLGLERFTTPGQAEEKDRDVSSGAEHVIKAILNLIHNILYPLAVLSIFQLIALVPIAWSYMKKPEFSSFILSLKDVSGMGEILSKTTEILAIFMADPAFLALMTISYILIIFVYARKAGSFKSLGIIEANFGSLYLKGSALGTLMMLLVFVLLALRGRSGITGFGLTKDEALTFFFAVLMWIFQGASEEVMFRGYMIPSLRKIFGRVPAIIISSLLFAAFHAFNAGFSILALVNIFMLAVLLALIYETSGSLVITCAFHTFWNMVQGSILGLGVSGNSTGGSLIKTFYNAESFGPEGTPEACFVITAALIICLVITLRRRKAAR